MPEGHLIHHYAREHARLLVGEPLAASSPQGKFSEGAAALHGQLLEAVEPMGKHLFYAFTGALLLHVHLGLRGLFLQQAAPTSPPRSQVRLRLAGSAGAIDLIAPRTCALVSRTERDAILARLGPDPLQPGPDVERVWARLHRSRKAIGAALLDQAVMSGVGNVLRAEVLNLVGIHPGRRAAELTRGEFDALWSTLEDVMRRAAAEGRIVTRVPEGASRAELRESESRWVYRQETCRRCGTEVEQVLLDGRVAYLCPRCQPR